MKRSHAFKNKLKRMSYYKKKKFIDGYYEDLMGDEEDRKYLNSLKHIEREGIIEERHRNRM